MKPPLNQVAAGPVSGTEPSDEEIRRYAYHLYELDGCASGRALDHWLEAAACLKAPNPTPASPRHLPGQASAPAGGEPHREPFFLRGENPLFLPTALGDGR